MKAETGWTPRLNGRVYCSPRCGLGCTKSEHDRAQREAVALAKRMGAGWEPVVWENLGWHYSANKGACAVHPDVRRTRGRDQWKVDGYTVYFNTTPQVVADAKTPEDALGFAIQEARGIERRIAADCAALLA